MDQKNVLIAIVLSAIVLIVWQYFVGLPQMEKQRQEAQQRAQQQTQQQSQPQQTAPTPDGRPQPQAPGTAPILPGQGGAPTLGAQMTREAVIAASPRIRIETPRLNGSISLKGGRIDDLALVQYREKVDPKSPPIVLLSPSGSPHPFYSEFGWVGAAATNLNLPGPETVWRQEGSGALGIGRPVTLLADNGAGLEFRRIIAVDDK
jgi:YidC/Oxa1 family membrane protein insertase